ncbi:MAG: putative DNA binding domain-containing protein [Bacteroidetes bacterium]|nr:putative DNA binding domain-containing protein [Bacteroidota bacterium]
MNIEELIKRKESQWLEFKESFGKEAIETVAAFSNASGGTLLIGVENSGGVRGVAASEESIKEWVNQIKQATQPQIFPEIRPIELDGKTVVYMIVQEYPIKPVSCKGKYFKRFGASNHLIPVEELVEMHLYSINSSFDSFKVTQTVADMQMNLVVKFFKQLQDTGRISLNDDPVVNLRKIGLLKDEQLTFAALLLFGEHHTGIHIGRFKTEDTIIDDILIHSPLALAVDEAMTFIKKCISIRYEFTGELRRKEIWQYPLPVLRELLLNAIIHKDYRNPTDIIIKIYDDRIRFMNPGALMGDLTPEILLSGSYSAMHRNRLLAEAFYLRGDIEKFGTGFFRIQRDILEYPELQLTLDKLPGVTRIGLDVIPKNLLKVTDQVTDQVADQVTDQDADQDADQVIQRINTEKQKFDTLELSDSVQTLLMIVDGEMTHEQLLMKLNLKHKPSFRKLYLAPALKSGIIEMTIPDKPNSRYQKYRLTEKGKKMKSAALNIEQSNN